MYGVLRQNVAVLFLGALLATAGGPANATIAISGSLGARAKVEANPLSGNPQIDFDSATWTGTPASLAVSAEAVSGEGLRRGRAYDSAQASWESADRGTINFGPNGWELTDGGSTSVGPSFPDGSWTYVFTAEDSGMFQMSYNTARFGDIFGVNTYQIHWLQRRGGAFVEYNSESLGDSSLANDAGIFRRYLVAGDTYQVQLFNNGNVGSAGGARAGWKTADFAWSISAVPEPGTWALAIAGFGVVGAALRRRRALAFTA